MLLFVFCHRKQLNIKALHTNRWPLDSINEIKVLISNEIIEISKLDWDGVIWNSYTDARLHIQWYNSGNLNHLWLL